MVVDSTDRERLSVIREELYKMLEHEVRPAAPGILPEDTVQTVRLFRVVSVLLG